MFSEADNIQTIEEMPIEELEKHFSAFLVLWGDEEEKDGEDTEA